MASRIILKRTSVAGKIPAATDLTTAGELALNMADRILYSRDGSGNIIPVGFGLWQSALTYSATTNIDIAGSPVQTLALTGNVTFTTSNRAAAKSIQVIVTADASQRTLTFPANWVWLGTKPANIAANKTGMLSIYCRGTAESDIIAAWGVQA
jgi:hypothetical protein